MNLEVILRSDLWKEVCISYDAGDYRTAIISSIHYLTYVIREKIDSDLDGYKLVNAAFGGPSPKLKINKLETQSEKDAQEGFVQILQGIYKGIRNPRSHDIIQDNQKDADAILLFIDYLLNILEASKATFDIDIFLTKVFDPDFVEMEVYAEELFNEIPKKKLCETLIRIFNEREYYDGRKLQYMTKTIINRLTDSDLNAFMKVVSEELQTQKTDRLISSAIQLIPTDLWKKVNKAPRMRIENKLLKSIESGEVILGTNKLRDKNGALGTWAGQGLLFHFELIDKAKVVIKNKLSDDDLEDNLYIYKYFLYDFPVLFQYDHEIKLCAKAAHKLILEGVNSIVYHLCDALNDWNEKWRSIFIEELKDLTNPETPTFYFSDGTPFLGKEKSNQISDDIPF